LSNTRLCSQNHVKNIKVKQIKQRITINCKPTIINEHTFNEHKRTTKNVKKLDEQKDSMSKIETVRT